MCERPGCQEQAVAAYGLSRPELTFWLTSLRSAERDYPHVLCKRHSDRMTVPNGWTFDDRRRSDSHLLNVHSVDSTPEDGTERVIPKIERRLTPGGEIVQLQFDGTGEIDIPPMPPTSVADSRHAVDSETVVAKREQGWVDEPLPWEASQATDTTFVVSAPVPELGTVRQPGTDDAQDPTR